MVVLEFVPKLLDRVGPTDMQLLCDLGGTKKAELRKWEDCVDVQVIV